MSPDSAFDALKLYAMVDQGAGRHEADLRALDPSEGFRQELGRVLDHLGVLDADVGP